MTRDNVEVPPIITKCTEAIEKHGSKTQGIYRIGGMVSKINNLKQRLDKGLRLSCVAFGVLRTDAWRNRH